MPRHADPRIGTTIAGRYELVSPIGKGGMGVVYRGVHTGTGRQLAVKLLTSNNDDASARRFLREARIAASVTHPNLVEVIDVGTTEDGEMYLVLELLEGEPLDAHLERKERMRPEDVLDALVPILDALAALHEAGVVHRDVKPSNIFLSLDGTARIVPKLLDLGISKRLDPGEALTDTGIMLGTPHYMSPEQARGRPDVGIGVDIWAMGVVLFEAITGERPFSADTVPGLLHKIATERPPPIAERVPGLPPGIAAVIDRALARDASSRHASASELADALVDAATDAGWALTCRMPSGPRISLTPSRPVHVPSAADLTPMLGSSLTPVMKSKAATPTTDPDPDTRDLPAGSIPPAAAPVSRSRSSGEVLAHELDDTIAASTPPASTPPAAEPTTTPSERLRQLTPSPLRYLLPIVGALALGAIVWIAWSEPEHHEEPVRPAPAAAAPIEQAPRAAIDAGAPIVRAAEPIDPPPVEEPAEPAPPPRVRPPRRRPVQTTGEDPSDETVPLGTNAAPIID